MRDIIWTLIIIWLVYRLVDVVKSISAKRSASAGQPQQYDRQQAPKRDIKSAIHKHLNNEGEYVDFEEVK